jgi:hypothetical protein
VEPALGRIVHYVSFGTPGGEHPSTCRAAIITEVHAQYAASLAVFNPSGLFLDQAIARDQETFGGGTWHPWELCPRPKETQA